MGVDRDRDEMAPVASARLHLSVIAERAIQIAGLDGIG
jgi:hypothetical protein